uniref:Uncharacterized protein n=1 Tax=Setaria viridis TaxID=4556 RepID=A0A4U6W9Q5_SETVI|nr:hypothetical protein SEVIR_1G178900v2 [Setaria viridis]
MPFPMPLLLACTPAPHRPSAGAWPARCWPHTAPSPALGLSVASPAPPLRRPHTVPPSALGPPADAAPSPRIPTAAPLPSNPDRRAPPLLFFPGTATPLSVLPRLDPTAAGIRRGSAWLACAAAQGSGGGRGGVAVRQQRVAGRMPPAGAGRGGTPAAGGMAGGRVDVETHAMQAC